MPRGCGELLFCFFVVVVPGTSSNSQVVAGSCSLNAACLNNFSASNFLIGREPLFSGQRCTFSTTSRLRRRRMSWYYMNVHQVSVRTRLLVDRWHHGMDAASKVQSRRIKVSGSCNHEMQDNRALRSSSGAQQFAHLAVRSSHWHVQSALSHSRSEGSIYP
jgi:hypothetical protein